ncbi:hypothetical protein [Methylobacterium sp. E-045]|uniref:hypothetical protein n=1 Tax=Methylobacterium sp. E-045 TaxID=2836575 RepID=UPI001FB94C24|nr:hypothetical protein [Methylobacterium sp. E-045]MCJ2128676.1 hypothetical protein [Methylobacterium sp. E-045]
MELDRFVERTLSQILAGISAAQSGTMGGNVAAGMIGSPQGANIYNSGDAGTFTVVDFDIAIKAVEKDGGQTIQVAGTSESTGTKTANENSNRVKFSVHLMLPEGDAAPVRTFPARRPSPPIV